MSVPDSDYLLGSSDREHERLICQAVRIAPLTERFLREAGIGPGQRVLDVSSGVGDVAMLAARLVGSAEEVVVFKTTIKGMRTGTVSSAGTLAGWFVMVKGNLGRFPGNKLWGDGWGWSWFDGTNPQKTTSTDYTTDCQSCHVPARQSDWIYTHGYPVLTR